MAHIAHHPAPGLGELIPGWFVVPANPIVPAHRIPHIGEMLAASFPVPQNPLVSAIASPSRCGMPNTSPTLSGMGCGCSAGCGSGICGSRGLSGLGANCGCRGGMCGCGAGMGFLESMDPMTMALVAGGLVLVWMVMAPGGSAYRQQKAALTSEYSHKLASLRGRERGYKRLARGASRGLSAAAARL